MRRYCYCKKKKKKIKIKYVLPQVPLASLSEIRSFNYSRFSGCAPICSRAAADSHLRRLCWGHRLAFRSRHVICSHRVIRAPRGNKVASLKKKSKTCRTAVPLLQLPICLFKSKLASFIKLRLKMLPVLIAAVCINAMSVIDLVPH